MKPLLPVFCRPMGYVILLLSMFIPFGMFFLGKINDGNLLFYKECIKLLMMIGALMILFAYNKNESKATEAVRNNATRYAMFITVLFVFGTMLFKVSTGDIITVDNSSFLTFLIINVLCLEFGIKKANVDNIFKK